MEVKVSYSKKQLDAAVDFIAKNNKHFLYQHDYIRGTILKCITDLAFSQDLEFMYTGTMGFFVVAEKEFEDFDNDQNTCNVEILVDPALCLDDFDWHTEIMRYDNGHQTKDY